jgi:hypothetical protein
MLARIGETPEQQKARATDRHHPRPGATTGCLACGFDRLPTVGGEVEAPEVVVVAERRHLGVGALAAERPHRGGAAATHHTGVVGGAGGGQQLTTTVDQSAPAMFGHAEDEGVVEEGAALSTPLARGELPTEEYQPRGGGAASALDVVPLPRRHAHEGEVDPRRWRHRRRHNE